MKLCDANWQSLATSSSFERWALDVERWAFVSLFAMSLSREFSFRSFHTATSFNGTGYYFLAAASRYDNQAFHARSQFCLAAQHCASRK